MSAWMCSEAHFNALLTYAVAMDVTFQDPRTNHTAITLETASAIGQIMVDENVRSLISRYGADREEERFAFAFTAYPHILTAPEAQCVVNCLEYQSCESRDWSTTLAAVILAAIEAKVISVLGSNEKERWTAVQKREYDACPWGIDSVDDFMPARREMRLKGGRYADRDFHEQAQEA